MSIRGIQLWSDCCTRYRILKFDVFIYWFLPLSRICVWNCFCHLVLYYVSFAPNNLLLLIPNWLKFQKWALYVYTLNTGLLALNIGMLSNRLTFVDHLILYLTHTITLMSSVACDERQEPKWIEFATIGCDVACRSSPCSNCCSIAKINQNVKYSNGIRWHLMDKYLLYGLLFVEFHGSAYRTHHRCSDAVLLKFHKKDNRIALPNVFPPPLKPKPK